MLNEIIKVDLHIHSSASGYKDGSIVESSNKDNIDVLLKKIEEFDIKLFAITDHNRFDYDLYSSIKGKLDILNRNNLPGVEFDVILEENKPKCHIVAIFNDKDEEKVKCIQDNIFSIRKLNSPDDNYTLEEFEKILRKINLDVILIVHQRQGLDNDNGDTDSLSNATDNPSKFIKVGFIDCLEYNFPRVEGIVKNSLREMGVDFPLITGSDCHDWNFYPYRGKGCTKERVFTSLKCLPSFKGLLMSITSFKTRVNRNTNNNLHFISEISINGINYPLSNGINAIIGDNGSGKTLLANLLGSGSAKYYASLIRENSISYRTNDSTFQKDYVNYISQGSIVEKVRNGNLFDDRTYFDDISSKELFSNKIKLYFEDILSYVRFNIIKEEEDCAFIKEQLVIAPINKNFYHPVINSDIEEDDISNEKKRSTELRNIYNSLLMEFENNKSYYESLKVADEFILNIKGIKKILDVIELDYTNKVCCAKVKGIIVKHLNDYSLDLKTKRTSEESQRAQIIKKYADFKKSIISHIRIQTKEKKYPEFPKELSGYSTKEYKGYMFTKTTKYNNACLKDDFYKFCFNLEYSSEEKMKRIKTSDELSKALKGSSINEIETFKRNKIEGFIQEYSKESTFISEVSSKEDIGNTPGEISLVYYKFLIQESESDFYVLIIDQPEDDINPKRICDYLIKYLSSIKDLKQVIIITHNPLLVINLDVDNVIYLNKTNNQIIVKNGAIEYENDDYSILDLIKENLDGGYEAVERRLKVYDKYNN